MIIITIIFMVKVMMIKNKKYNCSGPLAFKRKKAGYQFNQKLLHHSQHLNNPLNSYIYI